MCAMGRAATEDKILGDMKRFLPEAKATLIPAASVAPGRYATKAFGSLDEVYLFPDGNFAFLSHFDMGTSYDDGKWSVSDGFVNLACASDLDSSWAGKTKPFLPVTVMYKGKMESVLLRVDRWDETVEIFTGTGRNGMSLDSGFVLWLSNPGGFKGGEVAALKKKFDEDYGRHSFNAMDARFNVSFSGEGSQRDDGSFLINAPKSAELTIGGVKFRAKRVEISREMDVVRLSGSVEIVGSKLPAAPGVRIFIEGKEAKFSQ